MIEIKCSAEEKRRILKALTTASVCDKCKECNIKWVITDGPKVKSDEIDMDEKCSFSRNDIVHAGSKACTDMVKVNPMCMMIATDLAGVIAKTITNLFDKEG